MDLGLLDPNVLKCNVLQLLFQHPQGIKFGDFSGAFYQLHGFHPQFAPYGYRSLKELLSDMNLEVVQGGDPQTSVITNGFDFYHWLTEGERNGPFSFERKTYSQTDKGKSAEDAVLEEVLASVTSLLTKHKSGLRVKKLQESLLATDGIDLEKFTRAYRYKDTLEFLIQHMPELTIKYRGTRLSCVVQLAADVSSASVWDPVEEAASQKPDLSIALIPIREVLEGHRCGMKLKKLKKAVKDTHGFDMETCSHDLGYKDVMSFLQDIPELLLENCNKVQNCIVQLKSGPSSSLDSDFSVCNSDIMPKVSMQTKRGTPSPTPSLDSDFSADNLSSMSQKMMAKKPELSTALAQIVDALGSNPNGLDVETLKESLWTKHGFDLQSFSQDLGYANVTSCLLDMPGLSFSFTNGEQPHKLVLQLLSESSGLPLHMFSAEPFLDKPLSSNDSSVFPQKLAETEPASCITTPLQFSASVSLDSKSPASISKSLIRNGLGKKPATVLASLTRLLAVYKEGLRVKKVEELLLAGDGIDLRKFSIAQGHKDSLEFLEQQKFTILYREDRHSSVVRLTPGKGKKKKQRQQHQHPGFQGKITTSTVLASLTRLLADYKDGLRVKKVEELLLAGDGIDLQKFSIAQGHKDSLEFLEQQKFTILYREDRCSCVVRLIPETEKTTVYYSLATVLASLTSLLGKYKEGLRVKKVEELLLAGDGIDLWKFSIAQGHKDTLEFLEQQKFTILYREDRHSCVVRLTAGPGISWVLPLLDNQCPLPLVEPVRMTEPANCSPDVTEGSEPSSTIHDFSASKPPIQSLPDPPASPPPAIENSPPASMTPASGTIPNPPLAHEPSGALPGKAEGSSQAHHPLQRQVNGLPPAGEILNPSHLIKSRPSEDLDELKEQVAHILASHAEGLSLFQFRAAYSAAYQHHLPLGHAASAKQRLLVMPDVVCVKGYGVQTLLLGVSSGESPVKSGQPALSQVENTAVVFDHSWPKSLAMADVVAVPKPCSASSLPKAPGSQHQTISPLASDHHKGIKESCMLPEDQLTAPKTVTALQDDMRNIAFLSVPSVQLDLSTGENPANVPGHCLPKAVAMVDSVIVPKSYLKPSFPQTPVIPRRLYSECLKGPTKKERCPVLESPGPKAPKIVAPMQGHARTSAKLEQLFAPNAPVDLLTDPHVTRLDGNMKANCIVSWPPHLANPYFSSHTTPSPSLSQAFPDSLIAVAQPVVYPPITFLSEAPQSSSFWSAPLCSHSVNYNQALPQKTEGQSSGIAQALPQRTDMQSISHVQAVPQKTEVHSFRSDQLMTPIQSLGHSSCVRTVPRREPLPQVEVASRTMGRSPGPVPIFPTDKLPVNPSNHWSRIAHQPEYFHDTGELQHKSVPTTSNQILDAHSARVLPKSLASNGQRAYVGTNSSVSSPSMPSCSLQPSRTNTSQQHPQVSISSDTLRFEPLDFKHQHQYIGVSPGGTSSNKRSFSSSACALDSSHRPSGVSVIANVNYGTHSQSKPLCIEAQTQKSQQAALLDKQVPSFMQQPIRQYSDIQKSETRTIFDKCVIL